MCSISPTYAGESCNVVNGRLTLYITDSLSNLSTLISKLSNAITLGMSDGTLAASSTAIVRLQYLDNDRNSIPLDSPLLSENRVLVTSWPAIVGAIIAMGGILLLFVGFRRYHGRKMEKTMKEMSNDDHSMSDISNISLSIIWNEKALDGLEKAQSFKDFVSSQPVVHRRLQMLSPEHLLHRQGLINAATESAMARAIMNEPMREEYDDHGGITCLSPIDEIDSNMEDVSSRIRFSSSDESIPTEEGSKQQLLSNRLSFSSCSDSEYDYFPSYFHSMRQNCQDDEFHHNQKRAPSVADFAITSIVSLEPPLNLTPYGSHSYFHDEQHMNPFSPSDSSLSTLSSSFYK